MRKLVTAISAIVGLAVLTAVSGATGQPAAPTPAPAANPAVDPAMTRVEAFVTAAAIGGRFEIESSQLALERSRRDEVTAFAQRMVKDHTVAGEALVAAVRDDQLNVVVPDKLDAKHAVLLAQLHDAPQDEFDRLYLDSQLSGHRDAVALFRNFAQTPGESALARFARAALPTIEDHMQHIEALHKTAVIGAR